MRLPNKRLRKITLVKRIMNSLMEERFLSEMRDSEPLKFFSPQEKPDSSTSMVSINTATPLFKNVM
jgi:hypothetical protein